MSLISIKPPKTQSLLAFISSIAKATTFLREKAKAVLFRGLLFMPVVTPG
jgi:hypothetical protein